MLTYHHEKYVQIYLMVLLTKSATVFLFLVVHLFNPLIAKPHHTSNRQKCQGCLVVNAVVQENLQHIPQMTLNNRNITCENQFFLLNISVSHLMPSNERNAILNDEPVYSSVVVLMQEEIIQMLRPLARCSKETKLA
jgi:hypothetical protein